MCPKGESSDRLKFRPLTPETWRDFEKLFGKSGACGGCWCMWWRQTRREFDERHGEKNRRAMKHLVDSGEVPGVLAYADREVVGWCSVAPRESFSSLNRSREIPTLVARYLMCPCLGAARVGSPVGSTSGGRSSR